MSCYLFCWCCFWAAAAVAATAVAATAVTAATAAAVGLRELFEFFELCCRFDSVCSFLWALSQIYGSVFCPCKCVAVFGFECSGLPEQFACVRGKVLFYVYDCRVVCLVFHDVVDGEVSICSFLKGVFVVIAVEGDDGVWWCCLRVVFFRCAYCSEAGKVRLRDCHSFLRCNVEDDLVQVFAFYAGQIAYHELSTWVL